MAKGTKRVAYRAKIEGRLNDLGYRRGTYFWNDRPAQLLVVIGDEFRPFKLTAGQAKTATEYEMGRLSVWSEVLRLPPIDKLLESPSKKDRPAARRKMNGHHDPRQLDLVTMALEAEKTGTGGPSNGTKT